MNALAFGLELRDWALEEPEALIAEHLCFCIRLAGPFSSTEVGSPEFKVNCGFRVGKDSIKPTTTRVLRGMASLAQRYTVSGN